MRETKKVINGQFFTKECVWLKPQVKEFIENSNCSIAYDPFAGGGDLLNASKSLGFKETVGLDIDTELGWKKNDSLIGIPHINGAIIITNPPYLSNYSASRKRVMDNLRVYFESSIYDDLYLIALDKLINAQRYVVAIIPETFINSNYKQKNKLSSITVLEQNPFNDTDVPVCVACFDGKEKDNSEIKIYKNDSLLFSYKDLLEMENCPEKNLKIKFNVLSGWLGLRAVDTTNPKNMIKFDFKENFDYDWNSGIKVSSRLLSIVDVDVPEKDRSTFIKYCNEEVENIRKNSFDLVLSPFKGNMKNGVRRRRLDYRTARTILEKSYVKLYGGKTDEQLRLF